MIKIKLVLALLLLNLLTFAQNPVDNFINNPLLESANISLLVKDLSSGLTVFQFRPNSCTIPASTMKLVTTATALELLGSGFCFKTRLEMDGTLNSEGILNGNLYIKGGGDPTLGSEKLGDANFMAKWTEAILKAGIRKIKGKIVADATLYDEQGVNPKWTWEDVGNYYAAGSYGISYMDNTYQLVLKSGLVGTTPEILWVIPEMPELSFDNHLTSTEIAFDSAFFYGSPHSNLKSIHGEIPANRLEFIVKGDIPNPGLLLAQHFQANLIQNGISISQPSTDIVTTKTERKLIYTQNSPPLSEIITETNVHSNNGYAEQIFRYLALTNHPVATSNGAIQVIRTFWKSKGLPVDQLFQYDGCGLSPLDAVSARFFVDLLTYMKTQSTNKDVFFKSLPVSGKTGTLTGFLAKTPLQGKVHAKSGTISSVKSYAGYIEENGKNYVFAILVNNAKCRAKCVTKDIEEFLLQITGNRNSKR